MRQTAFIHPAPASVQCQKRPIQVHDLTHTDALRYEMPAEVHQLEHHININRQSAVFASCQSLLKIALHTRIIKKTVHRGWSEMQLHTHPVHIRPVGMMRLYTGIRNPGKPLADHSLQTLAQCHPVSHTPQVDVAGHTQFRTRIVLSHSLSFKKHLLAIRQFRIMHQFGNAAINHLVLTLD